MTFNERVPLASLDDHLGKEVLVAGWVFSKRVQSKVAFVDLRDATGIVQVVCLKDMISEADSIGVESVVSISGTVVERGEGAKKEGVNGGLEIKAFSITVVSASDNPPIPLNEDTRDVNENQRLTYRYLDLRTERMQKNIRKRHASNMFISKYLSDQGFVGIETPQLTRGTPEGAREFLVPSRIHPHHNYVLPQSPQQYKQLLMVSGFEKYFQIARCFRDEDQRQDRQPEFTQLDIEASFVGQEDILSLVESLLISLVENEYPSLTIQSKPFPRMTYAKAMEKYKTDKPDLREKEYDLSFCFVVDFPMFEKQEDGKLSSMHHPFTRPKGNLEEDMLSATSCAYDIVLNGFEIGGGSLRIHEQDLQKKVFSVLGLSDEEIERKFGHLLQAFSYGVPPHGGIALGLDRLYAILAGDSSIREVIAFPKTGEAKELLSGAPAPSDDKSLKDLGLKKV